MTERNPISPTYSLSHTLAIGCRRERQRVVLKDDCIAARMDGLQSGLLSSGVGCWALMELFETEALLCLVRRAILLCSGGVGASYVARRESLGPGEAAGRCLYVATRQSHSAGPNRKRLSHACDHHRCMAHTANTKTKTALRFTESTSPSQGCQDYRSSAPSAPGSWSAPSFRKRAGAANVALS